MGRQLLEAAGLLDPEAEAPRAERLLLRDGRIEARLAADDPAPEDAERVDLGDAWIAPGFVDLHYHGSLVFCGAGDLRDALHRDCASLAARGTTAFLVTSVAWPEAELGEKVEALAGLLPGAEGAGALPIGLHLEGPWIEPKAAGAQPAQGIRPCRPDEADEVLSRAAGQVRMVTYAPEVAGAEALVETLVRRDCVAALGHSLASAEQVEDAVARGARHVTHLWNAMGRLHHREPGLAGTALVDDRLSCDLIADGAHVDARAVRLAWRAKGEQLALISDRIDPPGSGASFGAGPLVDDGVALRLADGTLAGSRLDLDRAVRNLRAFAGASLLEAVRAATLVPARLLGIESERGSLRAGARADLVVLDATGHLRETRIAGVRVERSRPTPG